MRSCTVLQLDSEHFSYLYSGGSTRNFSSQCGLTVYTLFQHIFNLFQTRLKRNTGVSILSVYLTQLDYTHKAWKTTLTISFRRIPDKTIQKYLQFDSEV